MAAVTIAPGFPISRSHQDPDSLSTLPDPRSAQSSPDISRSSSASLHHPDLSSEVAALSNKLINAINHQTNLDDTLSATRHELSASQLRVRHLEAALQEHMDLVMNGVLVRKTDVEDKTVRLMANLADEKKQRGVVEKDKRGIEQELETLTTALFEEANQMVAAARKDRESMERRNEQLRAQLKDTELLLVSHQEQLTELKAVMQQMSLERDDSELITNASTAPSTPALQTQESMSKIFDTLHLASNTPGRDVISPAPPTSFTHLLHPILRTDLQASDDFHSLLQMSRKSSPTSRVTSASYGGLNVVGLGSTANREFSHFSSHQSSNGSTSSLSTNTYLPSPVLPGTPASTNSSVSSRDSPLSITSLKETRFCKRALTEDIEPTLRLETAPGLSWLARRTVINSMCEGTLVVEPMPLAARHVAFSCSLCGENKPGDEYMRTHRFRTSENENAQRYPLCPYCLNRLRASCDFLGFLRMVKDGHWRTDGAEAEALAWEECVRLREAMFWARIGGGVIPSFVRARESPRSSVEEEKTRADFPEAENAVDSYRQQDVEIPSEPYSPRVSSESFHASEKRAFVDKTLSLREDRRDVPSDTWERTKDFLIFEDGSPNAIGHDDAIATAHSLQNCRQETPKVGPNVLNVDSVPTLQHETQQTPVEPMPGTFDF
ncbi:rab guanine nucleotide exchange factor S2 [Pseudocyphellaria aurata]|nr:rab guanine nucleotide exchange factor S2 [Pseudocyphellaria aurata]